MSALTVGTPRPRRIGIMGYYGGTNLGDETVVAILIKAIRDYYPHAEIVGFSMNPTNTELRHGIKAFPLSLEYEISSSNRRLPPLTANVKPNLRARLKQLLKNCPMLFNPLKALKSCCYDLPWRILGELAFLRKSFQRLQGFDFLLVPGSGPLTDWWGGPWTHPYSLLSWTFLAKMAGAKFVALSIGSERLTTRLGKCFCKWALSMAAYRSFRDRYSRDAMEVLGLKGDNPVFPDQGFGLLDLVGTDATDRAAPGFDDPDASLLVGVSPIGKGCCVQQDAEDPSYVRYRDNLTAFLLWLVRSGHRLAFCHTDEFFDRPLVQHMIATIKAGCPGEDVAGRLLQDPIVTTEDLVAQMQRCDIMISSRYHAVVLPFVLQKPVLAISSYKRKIGDLMSEAGQGAYHLPMDRADVAQMIRSFRELERNRHSIAQQLEAFVSDYRSRLDSQYEEVFGPSRQVLQTTDGTPGSGTRDLPVYSSL